MNVPNQIADHPITSSVPLSPHRIDGVDIAKAIAVFAVVCLHLSTDTPRSAYWTIINQIARFAVPFFFMVAGFFYMRTCSERGHANTLRKYLFRIGVVFCTWALFYSVTPPFLSKPDAPILGAIRENLDRFVQHPLSLAIWGGTYHLWFLSSLLQGMLILAVCLRVQGIRLALAVGAGLYLFGMLAGSYAATPVGIHIHFDTMRGPFFSTLPIAIGATLARSLCQFSARTCWSILFCGLALHFVEIVALWRVFDVPLTSHSYVLGTMPFALGVTLVALRAPTSTSAVGLQTIGKYSLGIYVLHPYVIAVAKHAPIFCRFVTEPMCQAIIVFAITWAVVAALSRLAFLRPILK